MNKGIQIALKCLAVILALGLLSGYVWTRQRAAAPESAATFPVDEETGFPVTPATPTLFDTSKSGKLTVDPVLFSTSKSGPVDLGVTLVPEVKEEPLVIVDPETESEEAPAPILMPGSKSINMPLFNTKEVTKAITIWDGQTVKDADSEGTSTPVAVDSTGGVLFPGGENEDSVSKDPFASPLDKNAVVEWLPENFISSSKSLSTPIFDINHVSKWVREIEKMLKKAEGYQPEVSKDASE